MPLLLDSAGWALPWWACRLLWQQPRRPLPQHHNHHQQPPTPAPTPPPPLQDRMIHFSGCALNEACTIVLRGASAHPRPRMAAVREACMAFLHAHRLGAAAGSSSPCMRLGAHILWLLLPTLECTAHPLRLPPLSAGHHVLDEAERSLHDALCVLSQTVQDSRVIYGGGWAEMQVGRGVAAGAVQGRKALPRGTRKALCLVLALALLTEPTWPHSLRR